MLIGGKWSTVRTCRVKYIDEVSKIRTKALRITKNEQTSNQNSDGK